MIDKIRGYFQNISPRTLGEKSTLKIKTISLLGAGSSNLNYLIHTDKKDFVFRLNIDKVRKRKTKREFMALKIIESLRIAPRVYLFDELNKIFAGSILILEYIPGKSLDKISNNLSPKIIKTLSRMIARLHSIKVDKNMSDINSEIENIRDYFREFRDYRKQLAEYIDDDRFFKMFDESSTFLFGKFGNLQFDFIRTLTHGDVQEQNIIFNKGKLKLIDFEGMSVSDPAIELAYVFVSFGKIFTHVL